MNSEHFRLRHARMRVASLARAEEFYSEILGLHVRTARTGDGASAETTVDHLLSTGPDQPPLIVLRELPGAPPTPENAAGLFHLAFLVPDRPSLARVLLRLVERGWPVQGASDHGVSEAIYLADPDGNGLEIYADRPRADWPRRDGRISMHTLPLDIPGLLAEAPERKGGGLPPGTRLGHVHVRVRDLAATERFYTRELPLEVTVRGYPGALFFAADGYHHHVGANTWGVRSPQPKAPHAGLDAVAASFGEATGVVTDPDGNRFELEPVQGGADGEPALQGAWLPKGSL